MLDLGDIAGPLVLRLMIDLCDVEPQKPEHHVHAKLPASDHSTLSCTRMSTST